MKAAIWIGRQPRGAGPIRTQPRTVQSQPLKGHDSGHGVQPASPNARDCVTRIKNHDTGILPLSRQSVATACPRGIRACTEQVKPLTGEPRAHKKAGDGLDAPGLTPGLLADLP